MRRRFSRTRRATLQHGHICAVLSPSREIKVFAEGAELFTFRGAGWHLLDLQAKYRLWAEAVGDDALAMRIFQTALDLADAREGALFVVARDAQTAVSQLVAPADRLDSSQSNAARRRAARRAETCSICSRGARSRTWIPTCLPRSPRSMAPS